MQTQPKYQSEDMNKNERKSHFPVNLFCSLLLLRFIPFLYTRDSCDIFYMA